MIELETFDGESNMTIENGKAKMSYWPYCPVCKTPFRFDFDEPFAYCECGATEWGDPRPASYVKEPL